MLQVIKDLFTNIFELFSLIILIHYIQNIKDKLFNYYHNCYKLGTIAFFITILLHFKYKTFCIFGPLSILLLISFLLLFFVEIGI
jgi:hypothetical protein